jgi:hypothetical protein
MILVKQLTAEDYSASTEDYGTSTEAAWVIILILITSAGFVIITAKKALNIPAKKFGSFHLLPFSVYSL